MADPDPGAPALTNDDFRRLLAEAAARPRPAEPAKPQKPRKPKPKARAGEGGEEGGEGGGQAYR